MKKYLFTKRMLIPVLKLYPKSFRDTYDEQIEFTLQDILSSRTHSIKPYALCASLAEIAFFGIQLNIKEWAKMSQKSLIVITGVVTAGVFILASSVYMAAQGSCVLPGQCHTAGIYGARLTYPNG
ncbi:MAG TPA: hypothetical protein VGO07_05935, partial [Candidatus Saccharimonadales bacterium]|nr:hypothetical protein [Candidatus Saccharimonadales bacterium]